MSAPKKRLGLPEWIIIGLVAGIATGLFFGEACARLQILGDVFVGLLQMTVLPYIIVSLIGGIGRLSLKQSGLLAGRVVLVLVALWIIGLATVVVVSMAYPPQTSASFFSSSIIAQPKSFDFIGIFVPKNPFRSLVDNQVPAVVLFCLLAGVSLMSMKNKGEVLRLLDLASESLSKITRYMVQLSPLGVFFIAAGAAGTMSLTDIGRLQGYLLTSTLAVVGLGFVVLPLLITVFTPFRYRDVAPVLRSSFLLAFATGKTMVVLPMLIDDIKAMFEKKGLADDESRATVEILVPLGYAFPHLGRLLTTIFVPFAGWYLGTPLKAEQYPLLLGAGFFSHFSGATISIPFMLDLMRLPADMFQLFIITGVYVGRLGDGIGAAHLLTLTVVGACAVHGAFRLRWRKLGIVMVVTVVASFASIAASRAYLGWNSTGSYEKDKIIVNMQLLEDPAEMSIVEPAPNPLPLTDPEQSRLERARRRGVIRVGFREDSLPFSYFNQAGELVGFDIDMMHHMARDLDVSIEFVPISQGLTLVEQFAEDRFDLAVGGIAGTVERSRAMALSDAYLFVTMAFVVPDYRDKEFESVRSMRALDSLTIGVSSKGWFEENIAYYFPEAEIVLLDSPRDFFEQGGPGQGVDAFLHSAETGAAWTLLYPRFQVVTPLPRNITLPLVYPHASVEDDPMDEFLDHWTLLKTNDGTVSRAYDYWILGHGGTSHEPRWSIIRDVLGWVD